MHIVYLSSRYLLKERSDNFSIFIGVVGPVDREVHTLTIVHAFFSN